MQNGPKAPSLKMREFETYRRKVIKLISDYDSLPAYKQNELDRYVLEIMESIKVKGPNLLIEDDFAERRAHLWRILHAQTDDSDLNYNSSAILLN